MSSVNKVILVGNLGTDPEIRSTKDGKEIANFSIATSESWKDKMSNERKSKTEWHKIVIFQPGLVSIVKQYIKKGAKVYLEGSLQTRKWQDANGQDKYSTEIVLQGFNCVLTMLDGKNDSQAPQNNYESPTPPMPNVGFENKNGATADQYKAEKDGDWDKKW